MSAYRVCNPDGSCYSTNCDDINQPYQGLGSDFTMRGPDSLSYRYKLTGFYPGSTGVWNTRGFHVLQSPTNPTHTPADGTIRTVQVDGVSVILDNLKVIQTDLSLSYCPVTGCNGAPPQTLRGSDLTRVEIGINVPPAPGSTVPGDYVLYFGGGPQALDQVTPSSTDVVGYALSYALKGDNKASLCAGDGGAAQRAMFYQSAYWHPATFVKTGDPTGMTPTAAAITVTCELGAIAACMSWGYKPWELATEQSAGGRAESKDKWHATCVNAKTANYCGDGRAWTRFGTHILVQDPLKPAVMSQMSDPNVDYTVEARWDTSGATCVNVANRRIPGLDWTTATCGSTMPACLAIPDRGNKTSKYFTTGIP